MEPGLVPQFVPSPAHIVVYSGLLLFAWILGLHRAEQGRSKLPNKAGRPEKDALKWTIKIQSFGRLVGNCGDRLIGLRFVSMVSVLSVYFQSVYLSIWRPSFCGTIR